MWQAGSETRAPIQGFKNARRPTPPPLPSPSFAPIRSGLAMEAPSDHHHQQQQHQHQHHGTPFPTHPSCKLAPEELVEEERHFEHILRVFSSHAAHCERILAKYQRDYQALPADQQAALSAAGYLNRIEKTQWCSRENQKFYDLVTAAHRQEAADAAAPPASQEGTQLAMQLPSVALSQTEADNLRSLLRQLMRDWSAEGAGERDAIYGPILKLLTEHFGGGDDRGEINVLVPGAGLGRLAYEISQAGFTCQGNEFSLLMLLVSELFLTHSLEIGSCTVYPFALPFSNTIQAADQFRPICVPDVRVRGAPATAAFSMVAGDFLDVYRDETATWDAIVTCYFIDTAKNVLEYLRLIHQLLRPDGLWINCGPLLYHFEGHHAEPSIEPSAEEIRHLARQVGFVFLEESWMDSTYAQNQRSMHQTVYRCWCFKARKVLPQDA